MPRPRSASDESILRALGEVIGREGPHAVTLARVAAEAGLAPATIVQRFGSRHGLLLAFAQHGVAVAEAPFQRARETYPSPLAALRAALADQVSGVRSPERLANHLGLLHMDLADPELRALASQHATRVRQELTTLLDAARTQGELASDAPVEVLARSVQVAYNGSLITWALTGTGPLVTDLERDVDTVLHPYLTPAPRENGDHGS
ncbi:TetR/AcrR family transcriptional regulator [Spiractinospora alimapuensis]|uniref:TetR/AcrR family transcriptional regulator n=1 Tax=Spiractinospora alimapuensis TaxID=2820884 RepID=UPI001F16AD5C|nr:TetR/AcrR family transcriptional regulator [Spiractinospora alimapuensis]QVQ51191.1 TetR/AcrR family transcriptional regulator [Spiractinospora alimapuensis]